MPTSASSLHGLYSALFTPYDQAGRINFDMLRAMIRFQLAKGLDGFFLTGTTGEGLLLTTDERIELVEHVCEFCRSEQGLSPKTPTLIAHVGHPDSRTAAMLARRSAEAGVDWVGSIGTVFYGQSFSALMRHYSIIAEATDLPFLIYSFQTEIDIRRDVELFSIPQVQAIKYTGSDFFSVQQLAANLPRKISLISGMDEMFVAGQAMGFDGGIGSTYNFMPDRFVEMLRHCRANDFHSARQVQYEVNRVIAYFCQYDNWSYRKAFMRYIGQDCGPHRGPFAPLSGAEYSEFARGLDKLGLLEPNAAAEYQ